MDQFRLAADQFLRENMGHRFDRRLGGRVNSIGGKVVADDARRKIDDATSIPHPLGAFTHSVKGAGEVDRNLALVVLVGDLRYRRVLENSGIVY